MSTKLLGIYDVLKNALVERGWVIDSSQRDSSLVDKRGGEVREFVHPKTGKRMAYVDAILSQQEIEYFDLDITHGK